MAGRSSVAGADVLEGEHSDAVFAIHRWPSCSAFDAFWRSPE